MSNNYDTKPNGKNDTGRPCLYKSSYCRAIIKFFDIPHTREIEVKYTNKKGETWTKCETVANPLPFFEGFANMLEVMCSTVLDWVKEYPEFYESYARAKQLQLEMLARNSLTGLYNSHYAIFATKNLTKWRDKKDIEHSGHTDHTIFFNKLLTKAAALEDDDVPTLDRSGSLAALDSPHEVSGPDTNI